MKITKADKKAKVERLVNELMRIFNKDDQKIIDELVKDLICVYSINHAVSIAYSTWKELKKIKEKLKNKA